LEYYLNDSGGYDVPRHPYATPYVCHTTIEMSPSCPQ
jgi:hypothetical protein